jgi:hypothetical protein
MSRIIPTILPMMDNLPPTFLFNSIKSPHKIQFYYLSYEVIYLNRINLLMFYNSLHSINRNRKHYPFAGVLYVYI